jgi:hypothetical protein
VPARKIAEETEMVPDPDGRGSVRRNCRTVR